MRDLGLTGIIGRLRARWAAPQDVRAEAWALGGRHRGRIVEGARSELNAPGLPMRRAILLRAVIRAQKRAGAGAAQNR